MAYDYGAYGAATTPPSPDEMEYPFGLSLEEWARDKPLSILQLDPADRAVLRIAGMSDIRFIFFSLSTWEFFWRVARYLHFNNNVSVCNGFFIARCLMYNF